jgi:gliding motility-associated lipoprotein GldD
MRILKFYTRRFKSFFYPQVVPAALLILLSIQVTLQPGCKRKYTPKPRGYFRIDLPEKEYRLYDEECPYSFEYPVYGNVMPDDDYLSEPCWLNIEFPNYKGKIHLSYKAVSDNIGTLLEDSHTLAYKHTIKAQAINETMFLNEEKKVFGVMYDITGDAASSVQFFVTDSLNHYLRGSLYFNLQPNSDSLAPVISFFREDMIHLVESLQWKEKN